MSRPQARLRHATVLATAAVLSLAAVSLAGDEAAKTSTASKPSPPPRPAPPAAHLERLKGLKGFKVELVHAVDTAKEGSWVSMAVDPNGRLFVSDQYGKLFRVTPSAVGGPASETRVEPVHVELGEAQGMVWAFDSLYVVVNRGKTYESGLYRVRDTNADGELDAVVPLRKIEGGGEHGPHGIVVGPDGESLYIVGGNATRLPELDTSLVPRLWGEDSLIPRMPDGGGFMTDEKAPGGWICKVDQNGKIWELVSSGFRNPYDLAFNRDGELFTYDSDMEWDMNLPWYRPTRVCHAVSGSEFGYRNGSGKWPTYYLDSLPAVVDLGPGSPTGVAFGYGARFPARYQDALFVCDWSYGKLYAVHLTPSGASYTANVEEFLAGTPLPLTDLIVNPKDGALYFAVGGRRTTSGLYRIVYTGGEPTSPSGAVAAGADARSLRKALEAYHGRRDPNAVESAWKYLGHPDRFVRWAARVAIEFQDPAAWQEKALAETNPLAALPALLALVRVSAKDPAHRASTDPTPDPALRGKILDALDRIDVKPGDVQAQLDLLRVYEVLLNRFGKPDAEAVKRLVARFDRWYPSKVRELNSELAQLMVYLEAPDAAAKTVALLTSAPTQEEQIDYARDLRALKTGWTPALRREFFSWFLKAADFHGGNSFGGFMRTIKKESLANLDEHEKSELKPILEAKPKVKDRSATTIARPHVKDWSLDELVPLVESNLRHRDFDRGRSLFAAAACFSCHRFNNEGGGAGPDLTGLAGRFTTQDLLESIVQPSKVISDQYGAVTVATVDGEVVTGRIVNLSGDRISINTNMLDPNLQVSVDRKKIEEIKPSPVSMMPEGLLNTLNRDEVLDLLAYLLSRGDRNSAVFK
jgi:putative heme-binding domain-containing protein